MLTNLLESVLRAARIDLIGKGSALIGLLLVNLNQKSWFFDLGGSA